MNIKRLISQLGGAGIQAWPQVIGGVTYVVCEHYGVEYKWKFINGELVR